jgi:cytochrome P450
LRIYTPGPFAARILEEDMPLANGYILKKNVTLFYPLYAIHKNSKYWKAHDNFDPDRFEDQNNITQYSFCPFGFGSRICPGERITYMEIRMLLTLILQNFDFTLDMDTKDVIAEERFVLMAKNDVKIKLK